VKRSLLALIALALCISARADENIAKLQNRLQAEGLYRGNPTGSYDSETAAAVTRYQIRHGLAITGKLDAATSKELGITAPAAPPRVLSGSWRRLRSGEMEFVEQPSGSPKAKEPTRNNSAVSASAPNSPPSASPAKSTPDAQNPLPSAGINAEDKLSQAMRNYVAAFILAGLDPHIGSELEFFAANVDYFGARKVERTRRHRTNFGPQLLENCVKSED
jgi:peptidoglycan hydrolase-like protein with peptidoglycan-binding domain